MASIRTSAGHSLERIFCERTDDRLKARQMWFFRKPPIEVIRQFLDSQRQRDLLLPGVGMTNGAPPSGFVVDTTRIKLGTGEAVFMAGRAALERWAQCRLKWVEATPENTPIRTGETVALVVRVAGLWCLEACRIVYTIDEDGPIRRFGFANGTLPDHPLIGEERFLIEWKRADDSVSYEILAISRPRQLLARLGYPFVRLLQRRFRRDSTAAVLHACNRA
jgi:uncharacterized protein (UPF0548 family)